MPLDQAAIEHLAYALGIYAGRTLSDSELLAAAALADTLPRSANITQFVEAAGAGNVEQVGLPKSLADVLKPLLSSLRLDLCYAGRFAALFDSQPMGANLLAEGP